MILRRSCRRYLPYLSFMKQVCSICATFRERENVSWHSLEALPNSDVLLTSLPPTPTLPRSGHMAIEHKGQRYCMLDSAAAAVGRPEITLRGHELEADAEEAPTDTALRTVERDVSGVVTHVKVCDECLQALTRGTVPPWSLARCDAGLRPLALDVLTWIEELIVSPYRPLRHVVVCRPRKGSEWRRADTFHQTLRGHIIAVPNPSSETLATTLPLRPDALPEHISVVLIAAAETLEEVRELAKDAPVLHVRSSVIAAWTRHFCAVHKLVCDETALALWLQQGDGPPASLVATAVHAQTSEEATAMFGAWRERRGRYDGQDAHGDDLAEDGMERPGEQTGHPIVIYCMHMS